MRIKVERNGLLIAETEVDENGRFSIPVPLDIADNYLTVTLIDDTGQQTVKGLIAMMLVTDRAQEDVDRLNRLLSGGPASWSEDDAEWYFATVCRGAYNASDLNRVNRAMDYLHSRIKDRGYGWYQLQTVHHNIDGNEWDDDTWTGDDIPLRADAAKYIDNVKSFHDCMPLVDIEMPPCPENMEQFTHEKANDIERILIAADSGVHYLDVIEEFYAGEIWAGEV